MSDLTRRQKEVLDCIIRGVVHNGMPPTYREIGEELDINVERNETHSHETLKLIKIKKILQYKHSYKKLN